MNEIKSFGNYLVFFFCHVRNHNVNLKCTNTFGDFLFNLHFHQMVRLRFKIIVGLHSLNKKHYPCFWNWAYHTLQVLSCCVSQSSGTSSMVHRNYAASKLKSNKSFESQWLDLSASAAVEKCARTCEIYCAFGSTNVSVLWQNDQHPIPLGEYYLLNGIVESHDLCR